MVKMSRDTVLDDVEAGMRGGMSQGDLPVFKWKGEKPVEAFTVFMIAKQIQGSLESQPF